MTAAWDPQRYQKKHSFVWQYGESLLELLQPRAGERILDIGCGTGQLTAEIARSGATVIGLDNSPEMLAEARKNFPEVTFEPADAVSFQFAEPFDAIFSNAALHWVKDHAAVAACAARALRQGGRFVCEFGGKGCIASVIEALGAVLGPRAGQQCPWTFPSVGEFAPLLEKNGLEVNQAFLFDRPTPLEGENGIEDWLRMFCMSYFRGLSAEETRQATSRIAERLRPKLYREGTWTLDYRRLRIVAHERARR
ncbi:MAG TPA: methyltransferase domain-containing protein [Bryobacteraceae bacterium]|nr:methyltransferase domain-containing protein [Bryobacteraceae bacterium]